MQKLLLLILFSFLVKVSLSNQILKIAVIDSGLDLNDKRLKSKLCHTGHSDFTDTGIEDTNGHGTHVVGLIEQYAKDSNYCLIILKYFDSHSKNQTAYLQAVSTAIKLKASIINISGGGEDFYPYEYMLIKESKSKFIVAAGNSGCDLSEDYCNFYPAKYNLPNVTVVGNLDQNNKPNISSNFSNKVVWENGTDILSTCPRNKKCYKTGTSMSTAILTGKTIYEMDH